MQVVQLQDVTYNHPGEDPVVQNLSLKINKGQRLGLIGANGCGKTTVLNLIMDKLEPSSGRVQKPPDVRIGFVPQHLDFEPGQSIFDCVMAPYKDTINALRQAEEALADTDDMERALKRYERAREAYDLIDGDQLVASAQAMLDMLGLPGRAEDPVEHLSGGEQSTVALARALLGGPELLILDEPGNHLDHKGLAWLEDFLRRFRGAVLIVSHNRYLLDRVVQAVLHMENGQVKLYDGGYSAFRAAHLRDRMAQQADYVANQKRLGQLEALVKRFAELARRHADPAWGKRLRARRSQLAREKSQAVDRPDLQDRSMRLSFDAAGSKADIALRVEDFSVAFEQEAQTRVLFDGASMQMGAGERVALVGANGSGKSTLMRAVATEGAWDHPHLQVGPSMVVGWGSQHQESLRDEHTILEAIIDAASISRDGAFAILSRFMFSWADCEKTVGSLSGGERNRLQLAWLMVQNPNFLLLDEPTNHLDIPAREAIEEALEHFDGTVLVISHDRYFLDKIATRVVEVDEGQLVSYPGNFSDYWFERQQTQAATTGRVQKRRQERQGKGQSADAKASNLEARIAQAEEEKARLEARAKTAAQKRDHQTGRDLANKLVKLQRRIDDLYEAWLESS